jgi:hypothetical protein
LMVVTSTMLIKNGPRRSRCRPSPMQPTLTQSRANGRCCRRATLVHWLWLKLSRPLFRWKAAS